MAFVKQKFKKIAENHLNDPWALSYECELTEDFIENNFDKINWYWVLCKQVLSETFIKKHLDKILNTVIRGNSLNLNRNIEDLIHNQKLSEEFLNEIFSKFPDVYNDNAKYHFACVSWKQKLSEQFIRKHKDFLSWRSVCQKQKLSESFMIEHESYLDFKNISRHQKLSPQFIEKYFDKLDFEMLCRNKKLSPEAKKFLLKNSKKVLDSLLSRKR